MILVKIILHLLSVWRHCPAVHCRLWGLHVYSRAWTKL